MEYINLPQKEIPVIYDADICVVGRMLNADAAAFGALRVMVNLNQLGEAAGVAAIECIDKNIALKDANGIEICRILRKGGSVL